MLATLVLCLVAASAADPPPQPVNLALFPWGGIPTAVSSAPDMDYSAQKAADARADTQWVAGAGKEPLWLCVEWQSPVVVERVRIHPGQWKGRHSAFRQGTIEVRHDGPWQTLAALGSPQLPESPIEVMVSPSRPARAIRLMVESATSDPVAIRELEVLGPRPIAPMDFALAWRGTFVWVEPSLVMPQRQPERRHMRRRFELSAAGPIREAWLAVAAFDRLVGIWLNDWLVTDDMGYNGGLGREAKLCRLPLDALRAGENELAATVDDVYECGSRGLLAELHLIDDRRQRTVIATDGQWKGEADQGLAPRWREPGFDDASWVPCRVISGAGARWHGIMAVRCPAIAPQDVFEITELVTGKPGQPGSTIECRIGLRSSTVISTDYAVGVRLGEHSLVANHDYELGGTVLPPEEVKSSDWKAGLQRLTLRIPLPEELPRIVPATLLVSRRDRAAGLTCALPGCRADGYGLHFSIPLDQPQAPAAAAADGFSRNEIRTLAGTPTLCIDGRPTAPILWSSAYGTCRRYGGTGVKLFRPLVAGSPICAPGDEDRYYPWWFAQIDRMIESAFRMDPEIRVLPAVFMDPNPEVLFAEPSEQAQSGRGQITIPNLIAYPDRAQVRPTFLSHQWRRLGAEGLKRLVVHMRLQPYAPRVLGLAFLAGRGGENYYGGNELNLLHDAAQGWRARPRDEWDAGEFSAAARRVFREFLRDKYGSDAALGAAWCRTDLRLDDVLNPARVRREEVCDILVGARRHEVSGAVRDPRQAGVGTLPMDYYQCFAEGMLDTFAAWGEAVKEASDGRLLTGCYYGYTLAQLFTEVSGFSGHTAVARACRTPSIDIFCSPSEYDENRRAGGHYWGHNVIDSLRLHNKLWIFEQDSRTFLADIMPKTFDRAETLEVMKRDAAAALTRGAGWWWYEFSAGQRGAAAAEWFADPEVEALAGRLKQVYDFALTLPDRGPAAEIAVFYHGQTHTAMPVFPPALPLNLDLGRLTLIDGMQRIGAPFDLYNLDDLPELARRGLLDQYRLCVMLNPFYLTPEERQSLDLCRSAGRTVLWLWAPGLAGPDRSSSAEAVSELIGIPGVRLLQHDREPTCRLTDRGHPLSAGAPSELAPRPFSEGSVWKQWGNKIAPVPYVDPKAATEDTRILGYWVEAGAVCQDMAAVCVRDLRSEPGRGWASVYCAVPYLPVEMLRNAARFAGVHLYRESNDVLFADRHFVAVHTGAAPATDALRLPRKTAVYDVFGNRRLAATDRLPLDLPSYSTVLYYLGDPADLELP